MLFCLDYKVSRCPQLLTVAPLPMRRLHGAPSPPVGAFPPKTSTFPCAQSDARAQPVSPPCPAAPTVGKGQRQAVPSASGWVPRSWGRAALAPPVRRWCVLGVSWDCPRPPAVVSSPDAETHSACTLSLTHTHTHTPPRVHTSTPSCSLSLATPTLAPSPQHWACGPRKRSVTTRREAD